MNIRKSTFRRLTVTAFLGAIAIGGILAATEVQASLPGTGFNTRFAYKAATEANERARAVIVEQRVLEVKRDDLDDLGVDHDIDVDHDGFEDTTTEATPVKKPRQARRPGIFARLRYKF